ncbi:MAG: hypothetical protein HYY12_00765 [Candidatus Methylomirabilis oxyfera]|nr:hypothetical protein [Candidatus Methylomirabilis oxyfera]
MWPNAVVLAQDRAPARGRPPGPVREKESRYAEATRVVADRLAAAFPRVEGMIIGFEGDQVLIDRGTANGVFQGMELEVFREGEEFKHPLTMETLGRLDKDVGMLRVLQVRERYAVAAITRRVEKTEIRQGDQVRVSMARMIVAFPNVEVEDVRDTNTRTVTKDFAAALLRTGRFELIEDRQLRSMVLADKNLAAAEFADPRVLKQLAERGKAQALLLCRLTPRESGASLDVQVFSTLTGNPLLLASAEVKPAAAAHKRPSPAGPKDSGAPRSRPPGLATGASTESPISSHGGSAPRPAQSRLSSEGFRLGAEFDGPMQALAVGDLDGDGTPELLLAAADRLLLHRIEGRRLHPLTELAFNGKETVVVLETADLTGDGLAEVIVGLSQKGRVRSLIVQLKDGRLAPVWEMPNLVLRALSSDGTAAGLFGQEVPQAGRPSGPIHRYTWDGRSYARGQTLDAPPGLPLLGLHLADLGGGAGTRFLALKEGGVLEVHSQSGKLASYSDGGRLTASRRGASPRILVEGGEDAAQPEIIVGQEEASGPAMLRWITRRKAVRLTALRWNDARLERAWQTPLFEGTLADYGVADLGGGLGRHLLLLVVKEGRLGFGGKSEIQAIRLR